MNSIGPYYLSSPTFIDSPKHVRNMDQLYEYVISQDDNPTKKFSWVLSSIKQILEDDSREFENYGILISFHPFERKDTGSKTIEKVDVTITGDVMDMFMYTDHNYTRKSFKLIEGSDIVDLIDKNVKW